VSCCRSVVANGPFQVVRTPWGRKGTAYIHQPLKGSTECADFVRERETDREGGGVLFNDDAVDCLGLYSIDYELNMSTEHW
jgi:hypothetical protein